MFPNEPYTKDSVQKYKVSTYDYLRSRGYLHEQASIICGLVFYLSKCNPHIDGGIMQWKDERLKKMHYFVKLIADKINLQDPVSLWAQLSFVVHELDTGVKKFFDPKEKDKKKKFIYESILWDKTIDFAEKADKFVRKYSLLDEGSIENALDTIKKIEIEFR